ncbi:hypothetical protein quinque_000172 [Culex quinquefasciatus]
MALLLLFDSGNRCEAKPAWNDSCPPRWGTECHTSGQNRSFCLSACDHRDNTARDSTGVPRAALLIVTDSLTDHQPVAETKCVNIQIFAFYNNDSPLKIGDIDIPCNIVDPNRRSRRRNKRYCWRLPAAK